VAVDIPRRYTRPKTVTDPSTNRAQRRVTLLMRRAALYIAVCGAVRCLQIADGRIRFRYNLGAGGDSEVSLSAVNVSDGAWHWVHVQRHGQWSSLSLDHAEGYFSNETLPPALSRPSRHTTAAAAAAAGRVHFTMARHGAIFAGADVRFPSATLSPLIKRDFVDSKSSP